MAKGAMKSQSRANKVVRTVKNPGSLSLLATKGVPADNVRVPGVGFPNSMVANLRYHDIYSLGSVAGSIGKQVIRWNSIYDPDLTGVGHQPLFRDNYAAIYDHYAVVKASAVVKFVNTGTSAFRVGVVTDDDSSSSTTVNTLCEQGYGQSTLLPPVSGSLSSCTFVVDWDCQHVLKIDPFASETYKTAMGSDPTEDSTLVLWAATPDASTASIFVDVSIVYNVLFTELSSPTQS